MPDLAQKLLELGKYEVAATEFDSTQAGDRLAIFPLVFKLGAITMEGLALCAAANIAYNGDYKHAGKIAAVVAGIESIKFLHSIIEPKIRSYLNRRAIDYIIKDE